MTTDESTFTLSDGLQVYTKTWRPTTAPIAQVFFLHGFSDHCNAYYTFPSTLASSGIEIFSFDQRGWGRTAPQKAQWGITGPTSQLFADIDELLQHRLSLHPSIPIFLVGHSMGGAIALTYAYSGTYHSTLSGVAVWSPLISLPASSRPSTLTVALGGFAAKLFPNRKLLNKLDPRLMSRDVGVCEDFSADPLCHDTGTLQGIAAMLERGQQLQRGEVLARFPETLPVLVCHGTADEVTDCEASRRFVNALRVHDKTFRAYEGWFHKLHAEPGEDRVTFANDVLEWIKERCRGGGAKL